MYRLLKRVSACGCSKSRCAALLWIAGAIMFIAISSNFKGVFHKINLQNGSKMQNRQQHVQTLDNTHFVNTRVTNPNADAGLQPGTLRKVVVHAEGQIFNNDSHDPVYSFKKGKPLGLIKDNPDEIYQRRRELMLQACSDSSDNFIGNYTDQHAQSRIYVDLKQNLGYCSIEKIASTFWKRLYRIVIGESRATSPFDRNVVAHGKFKSLKDIPKNNVTHFVNRSTKFLFVRDPYTRLLSGYVDKLFSPNTFFWNVIGKYAISLVRKNVSLTALNCGHDLSFREFVKYIIHAETNNVKRNGHYSPAYDHCKPCQYKYDIIGKFETLKEDTLYILDKIGKPELRQELKQNFRGSQVKETITDQVGWLFGMRGGYKGCLSFYDAQKRMWKKFQIRGIISKMSRYPVKLSDSEKITKTNYSSYALAALGDAVDYAVAKKNKEDALIEAYSTVDRDDLEKLREIFKPDCELFGYDCRPDKIFKQTGQIKPWYFDISTA